MIIELVGLPGSGKSTIARSLAQKSDAFYPIRPPHIWSPTSAPFFLTNLADVLWKTRGALPRWDLPRNCNIQSLLLNGWDRHLVRAPSDRIGVIDQGPVFNLGRFDKHWHRTGLTQAWVQARYERWASTIDCIVYLDGDDDVLARRVRTRPKRHPLKGMSHEEYLSHIRLHRQWLNRVVERLISSDAGPRLVTCQTDHGTPSETVGRLIQVLDEHLYARPKSAPTESANPIVSTT